MATAHGSRPTSGRRAAEGLDLTATAHGPRPTSGRSSRAEDRRAGPARAAQGRGSLAAATSGPGRRGPGPAHGSRPTAHLGPIFEGRGPPSSSAGLKIGRRAHLGPPRAAVRPPRAAEGLDLIGGGLTARLGPQGRPRAAGPNLGPVFEGSRPGGPDLMARPSRAEGRAAHGSRPGSGRPRAGPDGHGSRLTAHLGPVFEGPRIGGPVNLGGRRAQDRAAGSPSGRPGPP